MIRRAWNKHHKASPDSSSPDMSESHVDEMTTSESEALVDHPAVDTSTDDDDDHDHAHRSPLSSTATRIARVWPVHGGWRVSSKRLGRACCRHLECGSLCGWAALFLVMLGLSLHHSSVFRQRLLQFGEDSLLRPLLSVQIKPSSILTDNLETGRFCIQRHGMWKCYDCGRQDDNDKALVGLSATNGSLAAPYSFSSDTRSSTSIKRRQTRHRRKHCKKLQPRGACKPFLIPRRNAPLRLQQSPHAGTSNSVQQTRTLGLRPRFYYQQQPVCATLGDCWDLDRCRQLVPDTNGGSNGTVKSPPPPPPTLTIYLNESDVSHYLLDYAIQALAVKLASSFQLERVDDYRTACLVLVTPQTYSTPEQLQASKHWRYSYASNNRQYQYATNHLLWHASYFFLNQSKTIDLPFALTWHAEQAALASVSLDRDTHRPGYDIVLPLPRDWGRNTPSSSVLQHQQRHVPRKWLLGFRGKVQATPHVYYQHRWLAAEYWIQAQHDDYTDIVVDVKCQRESLPSGKKIVEKDYDNKVSYSDILWNSTFGFAPGGSGVGSFRFGEILSTGGIPVVLPEFVTPFSPEIDWSDCVVVVSEARIVDLPRILRTFTSQEIQQRRQVCWKLLQATLGDTQHGMFRGETKKANTWHDDERVTFTLAMEIWTARLVNALTMKRRITNFIN